MTVPTWAWLLVVGVAGAFIRAWRDHDQHTWGRETVTDCVVGGVSSILVPPVLSYYLPDLMKAYAAPPYQAVIVFLAGFGASFTWVLLIRKRLPAIVKRAVDKANL